MAVASESVPLLVTLGHAGDNSLNLRFPPQYADEILPLLDENGVDHNSAIELSADSNLWIEVVHVLAVPGGLTALAAVLRTIVHRHDGKRFVLKRGDYEVDARGYSEKETEQFLETLQADQARLDSETRRVLGLTAEKDE